MTRTDVCVVVHPCARQLGGKLNERIGELLVKENLLSADQLQKARSGAAAKGRRLGAEITEEKELTLAS